MRDDIFHLGVLLFVLKPVRFRLCHHRVCDWVRVMLFETGSQTEHLPRLTTTESNDIGHFGAGVRQCAGLIKDTGIGLCDRFQEPSAFRGNVMPAAFPHSR